MEHLTVYKSKYPKIRFGNKIADGGYVISEIDSKYDAFFSCGISNDITFELDFLKKYPINCFAYDGTVQGLPDRSNSSIKFYKTNISPDNTKSTTNLHKEIEPFNDIFLKMDIETFEFRWFRSLKEEHLKKFKQMVIEFHFPFTQTGFTHLDVEILTEDKMSVFKTISRTHKLIHFHPNNCCGTTIYNGIVVPNVFECTYIRRDVDDSTELNTESIPSSLDVKNVRNNPEIYLNHRPFVNVY
jgi:hypothetical protein